MDPIQTGVQQQDTTELTAATMPAVAHSRLGMTALLMLASFVASAGKDQEASAQEPTDKRPVAGNVLGSEGAIQVTPAVRATPEFKAGHAEGRLAGQLEGIIQFLKRDMKDVSAAIEKNGSDREKNQWAAQAKDIEERIAGFEKGMATDASSVDLVSFGRALKTDVTVVNTFSLLTRRLETVPNRQAPGLPVQGGNFRVETGDIIALKLFKLVEPMVDEMIKDGGLRLTPRPDGSGFENPLPSTTQESIKHILGGVGAQIKSGMKADGDRIKQKRAEDARKRAEERLRKQADEALQENLDPFSEPLRPGKGN